MQGQNVKQQIAVNSPAEMIQAAVAAGTDLDKLKGLLELQERWDATQAKKAYHKAMSDFKANPIEIDKDKEVAYGNTSYKHATLANVVRVITKELSKHDLSAAWSTNQEEKEICVTCRITHALGHSEETTLCGPADSSGSKNAIQAVGSTVTYLQRYTLLAATGLATSEQDDDAKNADVFINAWQIGDLQEQLKKKEWLTESLFLKYMGVDTIENIKATDYKKAEAAINNAKKKEAGAK